MAWKRRVIVVGRGPAPRWEGAVLADGPSRVREALRPVPGGTVLVLLPSAEALFAEARVRFKARPPLVVAVRMERSGQGNSTRPSGRGFDASAFLTAAAPVRVEERHLGSAVALLVEESGRRELDPSLWLPEPPPGQRGVASSFARAVERCPVLDVREVAREWRASVRTCDRRCRAMAGMATGALLWRYTRAFVARERSEGRPLAEIAAGVGFSGERPLRKAFARRGCAIPGLLSDLAETEPGLA